MTRTLVGRHIALVGLALMAIAVLPSAQAQLPLKNLIPGSQRKATGPAPAPAQAAPPAAAASSTSAEPKVVATVNGEEISRQELATECLAHYGSQVLERVLNKYLIIQECQRRQITVTDAEVNAEIAALAKSFSLPVDRWLEMLKEERGINPGQYRNDIIWPTLALRKLAGGIV
jgi:foldase protein PrsA